MIAQRFSGIKLNWAVGFPGIALGQTSGFSKRGNFSGVKDGMKFIATWPLFLIDEARHAGCSFEDLADGFGAGRGTMGDWSGIRDSSEAALERMTERALNFLFER